MGISGWMRKKVCWAVVLMGRLIEEFKGRCTVQYGNGPIPHLGSGFNKGFHSVNSF